MPRTRWLLLALTFALAPACGGSDRASTTDVPADVALDAPDTAEPGPDVPPLDADDGEGVDTPDVDASGDTAEPDAPADVPDAGPEAETVEADAETVDAAPESDVPPQTEFVAVPGARCTPASRLGLVQVYGNPWSAGLDASAMIYDRVDPWMPGPKLTDASCSFFEEADPTFCQACPQGQFCAPDATCQARPAPLGDVVLTLTAGADVQTFTADGGSSGAWGTVTLPGRTFAVEVTWAGFTVTLGATPVPEPLADLGLTLAGEYDTPTALDLTWTPPVDGAAVFTHIPINHHAGGPTFTECAVDASAGALHVDGAMLAPLAVITGLEFQGIEHARFAAVDTPQGCVEVRFGVQQFPN